MKREKEVELMSSTVIQEIKRVSYCPVNTRETKCTGKERENERKSSSS